MKIKRKSIVDILIDVQILLTMILVSSFRNQSLDAFNLCTHESRWCPIPPCDLPSFNEPICNNYICRKVEPHGKECVFIGDCNGDEECIKTAQYLGVSSEYYGDSSSYTEGSYAQQDQELQVDASASDTYTSAPPESRGKL